MTKFYILTYIAIVMPATIFTIGHSNHAPEYFGELLTLFGITCLIDVRSVAASAYNPQYNKEPLLAFLKNRGISYLHFAAEFGARHTNAALLDTDGRVDFEKVRQSTIFRVGVERLRQGLDRGYTIGLMCSEAEPFDCHRFAMISKHLTEHDFEVWHILNDKTAVPNADLEDELLKKYRKKIPQPGLFEPHVSRQTQLEVAYRLRNQDIGWSPDQLPSDD